MDPNINDEMLRYYIALQDHFPHDWKVGDASYDYEFGMGIVYDTGRDQGRDYVNLSFLKDKETISYGIERPLHDLFRIPRPIDTENPERGLLGMLNDFWSLGMTINNQWAVRTGLFKASFIADTPTLAFLKALAHQWEVTV